MILLTRSHICNIVEILSSLKYIVVYYISSEYFSNILYISYVLYDRVMCGPSSQSSA